MIIVNVQLSIISKDKRGEKLISVRNKNDKVFNIFNIVNMFLLANTGKKIIYFIIWKSVIQDNWRKFTSMKIF